MSELVWVRKKTGMPAAPVCKIKTIQPGKELPILTFPVLDSCGLVEHLFTTRFGGVSKGIYATTNLSFGRADDDEEAHDFGLSGAAFRYAGIE